MNQIVIVCQPTQVDNARNRVFYYLQNAYNGSVSNRATGKSFTIHFCTNKEEVDAVKFDKSTFIYMYMYGGKVLNHDLAKLLLLLADKVAKVPEYELAVEILT